MNVGIEAERHCSNKQCAKLLMPGKEKKCSRCMIVFYCSADCQRVHWTSASNGHRGECKSQPTLDRRDPLQRVVSDLRSATTELQIVQCARDIHRLADDNNEAAKKKIGGYGVCELLLEKMRALPDLLDVAIFTISVIVLLCNGEVMNVEENRRKFIDSDAVKLIATLIDTFPNDWQVASQGCAAIKQMSSSIFNKKKLKRHGGCAAILTAVRRHPANVEVQKSGLLAIFNMTTDPDGQKTKTGDMADASKEVLAELRTALTTDGAFDVVLSAMRVHRNNREIAGSGLKCCLQLSLLESNQNRLDVTNGTWDAVQNHRSSFDVCGLWYRMIAETNFDDDTIAHVGDVGACEFFASSVDTHYRSLTEMSLVSYIVPIVLRATGVLAKNYLNRIKLAQTALFRRLVDLFTEHYWNVEIAQTFCDVMEGILRNDAIFTLSDQEVVIHALTGFHHADGVSTVEVRPHCSHLYGAVSI